MQYKLANIKVKCIRVNAFYKTYEPDKKLIPKLLPMIS